MGAMILDFQSSRVSLRASPAKKCGIRLSAKLLVSWGD